MNWQWMKERYKQLEKIGFESTLGDYHSKAQRKLMTPELRKKIKERDNYTCQECGKFMPDEVGLHIDHIIPVAKGGKSVPSNLRVLCSKCNGSKGAKITAR
jgi:5-methylcytosine-specific restriction endonuclease McrA